MGHRIFVQQKWATKEKRLRTAVLDCFKFVCLWHNNVGSDRCMTYEVCLKSIGTVCFAQTTLATVIKALFFKMAQCLVVVKM